MSRREVLRGVTATGAGLASATAATGQAQGGGLSGGCLTDWPAASDRRIDLTGAEPVEAETVPVSGDLVLSVHGIFGPDVLHGITLTGANQASALRQSLADVYASRDGEPPETAVATWDSTTAWTVSKWRADDAGETLGRWLEANDRRFDSITLVAHSLGARVALSALESIDSTTVDSVALLGAAVDPDVICTAYREAIETHVEGKCYNYYSDRDTVGCYSYAIREWTTSLGCAGRDCDGGWFWTGADPPINLVDVDVSATVAGHCHYVRPDTESFSGGNCVAQIVDNQLLESQQPGAGQSRNE